MPGRVVSGGAEAIARERLAGGVAEGQPACSALDTGHDRASCRPYRRRTTCCPTRCRAKVPPAGPEAARYLGALCGSRPRAVTARAPYRRYLPVTSRYQPRIILDMAFSSNPSILLEAWRFHGLTFWRLLPSSCCCCSRLLLRASCRLAL